MSWLAPQADRLSALVRIPGSKSETNRALILAALSDGESRIYGALKARDSDLMVDGLRGFGVDVNDDDPDCWLVAPPAKLTTPTEPIDCGLAGTVMRFLPPLALVAGGTTTFIGDERASERPLAPLLAGLEQLGAEITTETSSVPFTIKSPAMIAEREVTIDSSASSQFISGLLLSGALLPNGLDLRHSGEEVPSLPHIQMTIEALAAHGVEVLVETGRWQIEPTVIRAADIHIQPDLTNAAAFLAAVAIVGGTVKIADWPEATTQPGAMIVEILRTMGCTVSRVDSGLQVESDGSLKPIEIDLSAASELTPVVAALVAFADGKSTISGVAHIRLHETDRLAALEEQITACGIEARQTKDGLVIIGQPKASYLDAGQPVENSTAVQLKGYGDHRLAHSAALLGLVFPVSLDDVSVTSKTMPDFPERWASMIRAGR